MLYLYETHLHTCQSSVCAQSLGSEYIKRYKELGYAGIIVTDHFYNGNSCISRNLPWRTWVERFCAGYEDAKNEGERQGLDVFFGWEETFDNGDDYLVYGLSKEWLLEHAEARYWSRREQFENANRYGGCVVQAHPFRDRYYIPKICLSTGCVNAIEAANAGNEPNFDALAKKYAFALGLPVTAGSDIHTVNAADNEQAVFGVLLDKKMASIQDYVACIKEKRINGLKIPTGRCAWRGKERINLPVEIRDAQDEIIKQDVRQILNK
jgi:hypothetical protein